MPFTPETSSKLVRLLVRKQVRNKLNDVLSDLKREFGDSLQPTELNEVALGTVEMMREFSAEFCDDMRKRFERDAKGSPSVAARGRKESLPSGPTFAPAEGPERK